MNAAWEAWLDRTKPIEISTPLYQYTTTTITFTVLDADRDAVDLTGYIGKFSIFPVDTETELLDKSVTIADVENGQCTVILYGDEDLTASKEALAELRLWSSGNTSDPVTHRIQFRCVIAKALVQGASS